MKKSLYRLGFFILTAFYAAEDVCTASQKEEDSPEYGFAQYKLGERYKTGNGVRQDDKIADQCFKRAFTWSQEAADRDDAEGQYLLGHLYQEGRGVGKSPQKAFEFYQKAVEKDYLPAFTALALVYLEGLAVEQAPYKALELYQKAAGKGCAEAQNKLGSFYRKGLLVEKSPIKAFELYKESALQGSPVGQCNLGCMYEVGEGVEKDIGQAIFWYQKSAAQGCIQARQRVEFCLKLENAAKSVEELTKEISKVGMKPPTRKIKRKPRKKQVAKGAPPPLLTQDLPLAATEEPNTSGESQISTHAGTLIADLPFYATKKSEEPEEVKPYPVQEPEETQDISEQDVIEGEEDRNLGSVQVGPDYFLTQQRDYLLQRNKMLNFHYGNLDAQFGILHQNYLYALNRIQELEKENAGLRSRDKDSRQSE